MSVLQIRPAAREGARLCIVLAGTTGSGKTRTALLLAYGLANYDASKVGFLDTENRRGSLHADALQKADPPTDVPFLIGDLIAPFSPQRYADAIKEFQAAGIEVLIVDSGSHEWEGTGGCQDIAGENNKYWNKAKKAHKSQFMSALLQTDMHIIVCLRAHEKVKIVDKADSGDGKTQYVPLGLQPIQEKSFMFDATASLMMYEEGKSQTSIKIPAELRAILGRNKGYIVPKDGKDIRDWVDGAKQLDPMVERYRNRLISSTERGVKHIEDCWNAKTPEDIRQKLGVEFFETLKQSAKEFDDQSAGDNGDQPTGQTGGADPTKTAIETAARQGAAAQPRTTPNPTPQTPPTQTGTPPAQPAARTPASTNAAAATARPAQRAATPATAHRPAAQATTNRAPVEQRQPAQKPAAAAPAKPNGSAPFKEVLF